MASDENIICAACGADIPVPQGEGLQAVLCPVCGQEALLLEPQVALPRPEISEPFGRSQDLPVRGKRVELRSNPNLPKRTPKVAEPIGFARSGTQQTRVLPSRQRPGFFRVFVVLLILVTVAGAGAIVVVFAPGLIGLGWVKFHSDEGRFGILFPKQPESKSSGAPVDFVKVTCKTDDVLYEAGWLTQEAARSGKYEKGPELTDRDRKILSSEFITFCGYRNVSRQKWLYANGTEGYYLVFAAGNSVYYIGATGLRPHVDLQGERFANGFTFEPGPP